MVVLLLDKSKKWKGKKWKELNGDKKWKKVHPDKTIKNDNKSSYDYWSKKSTKEIIDSLKKAGDDELLINKNGTIMDGNTRTTVLKDRGIDINDLKDTICK